MEIFNKKDFSVSENTIVAIGNFDGFHRGHQQLISRLINEKNNTRFNSSNEDNNCSEIQPKSVVFSFYPHPLKFTKNIDIKTILTLDEKIDELDEFGVDYFINYPFDNDTMNLEPEEFVKTILVEKLNIKKLIVGEGFRFGRKHSGNVEILEKLSEKYNFELIRITHENENKNKISSTTIRELVDSNNFKEIKKLLGKDYYVSGKVISGKMLGRTINFPTANIKPMDDKLLPKNGVYVTETEINGKIYRSVSNVGVNPTTDNLKEKIIETHIFEYKKDIYGKEIKVKFYEFVRPEKKFNNLQELKEQIEIDCNFAKAWVKDGEK